MAENPDIFDPALNLDEPWHKAIVATMEGQLAAITKMLTPGQPNALPSTYEIFKAKGHVEEAYMWLQRAFDEATCTPEQERAYIEARTAEKAEKEQTDGER